MDLAENDDDAVASNVESSSSVTNGGTDLNDPFMSRAPDLRQLALLSVSSLGNLSFSLSSSPSVSDSLPLPALIDCLSVET